MYALDVKKKNRLKQYTLVSLLLKQYHMHVFLSASHTHTVTNTHTHHTHTQRPQVLPFHRAYEMDGPVFITDGTLATDKKTIASSSLSTEPTWWLNNPGTSCENVSL